MKRKKKQGKDLHLEYLSMEQTPKDKRKKKQLDKNHM